MTTQLLALDSILPSLLVFGGLVFLAIAFLPFIARTAAPAIGTAAALAVVGIACIAVGVVLWTQLLKTAGNAPVQAAPAASSTASPVPAPVPTTVASASGSGSAAASASAAATATPVPLPTATLVPIAPVAFQPDTTGVHGVVVAVESFEHGLVIYRDDTKQELVLLESKTFKVYPDTWDETQPSSGGLTPPSGKLEPKRGIGKLWRANPDVRQSLGWALSPEAGMSGQVSGDGNSTILRADITYVLKKDGTYTTQ